MIVDVKAALVSYLPLVVITFVVALAAVAGLVPSVRAFAHRIRAVQTGGSEHGGGVRQHSGAVPNIGGIAILGGFLIALIAGSLVAPDVIDDYRVELLAIALGGALMTLVGFLADMWEVGPALRLAAQVVAAGLPFV